APILCAGRQAGSDQAPALRPCPSVQARTTVSPALGGFLSAVRPPAWPVAFPRQGIGTMLLIGSPLAWTGTHSSLARGDHAHRPRSRLDAPLGVRARGHRPTPQRAGTLLGNLGTADLCRDDKSIIIVSAKGYVTAQATCMVSMGRRDRRCRRVNLLRPYAL